MDRKATNCATPSESRDRALFDRIAAEYCNKDLCAASSLARRYRLLRTLEFLDLPDDLRILEVGCGAGFSAGYLAGRYREYVGIDYSSELIGYARRHNANNQARFYAANVKDFTSDHPFDLILLIGVLHHMDDMKSTMHIMVELLRPGGWIAANEPQPANPAFRAARKIRQRADRAYSHEQCELSASDLLQLFGQAGLEEMRIVPQGLFSTPFAEVVLNPQLLTAPLARAACFLDGMVDRHLRPLTWNLIATGRKPDGRDD